MARAAEPVVLELASLPREQMGPFLLLGLDKSADPQTIERHWAERIKWARRNTIKVPLEDINWARESLGDVERRLRADIASMNVDTANGLLSELCEKFGVDAGQATRKWQPLDNEKQMTDYAPGEVPEISTVAEAISVPEIAQEMPTPTTMLQNLAAGKIDPWGLQLPGGQETNG